MKRLILLISICLLLVGCGSKEKPVEESTETANTVSTTETLQTPVQLAPPTESDTKEASTMGETAVQEKVESTKEKVESTSGEEVELSVEDFKDFTLDINEDKPMEITVDIYGCTIRTGLSLNTKDEYLEVMGNTFIYQDGVNYTIIGEQYHKCAGPSVMEEKDDSNGFDISSEISSEDVNELDNSVIENITNVMQSGDFIILNGYVGDEEETVPIEIIIDANTHELISFGTHDEETGMNISCLVLDVWKPVPDVEFKEVDLATIEEDVGSMLQSAMGAIFMGAASDPNLMNEFNEMAEYTNEFDITFEDEFDTVDLSAVENIGLTLENEYGAKCCGFSYSDCGCTLMFRSKEELSTENKEELRKYIFDYFKSLPDTVLHE